jgi:hypothetical protein
MSDTIQERYEGARRALLLQATPDVLINAVESRQLDSGFRHTSAVHRGGNLIVRYAVGAGAIGAIVTGLTGAVVSGNVYHPTGGLSFVQQEALDKISDWVVATKGLLQKLDVDAKPATSATAKLRVARLASVQAAFGLSTQAMASVLSITRQGLYKWFDESKDITLQEASRQRLAMVERLADLWRNRSNAPLSSMVHEPLTGGRTVLELLTDDVLDEGGITGAFDELVGKLQGKPKSPSQKMVEAGFTRRRQGKSLPDDE